MIQIIAVSLASGIGNFLEWDWAWRGSILGSRFGLGYGPPMSDSTNVIETAAEEAFQLLCERLVDAGSTVPAVVMTVTPAGAAVIRANCGPGMLRDLGRALQEMAFRLETPAREPPRH